MLTITVAMDRGVAKKSIIESESLIANKIDINIFPQMILLLNA